MLACLHGSHTKYLHTRVWEFPQLMEPILSPASDKDSTRTGSYWGPRRSSPSPNRPPSPQPQTKSCPDAVAQAVCAAPQLICKARPRRVIKVELSYIRRGFVQVRALCRLEHNHTQNKKISIRWTIPDTWCLVPDTWQQTTRYQVPGTGYILCPEM